MKCKQTSSFSSDFKKLSADEKQPFRDAVKQFNQACDRFVESGGAASWPAALRVKKVQAALGVWEMTWSFSGADGRATWEWSSVAGEGGHEEAAVLWRRIGGHSIFKAP